MRSFYYKVSHSLEEIVKKDYGLSLKQPLWELPQRPDFGDLSSMAALKLASKLKKDPLEIAGSIKLSLEQLLTEDIEKVEILRPGFINIFTSQKTLTDSLNRILKTREKFFRYQIKKKVLIEFLSANPTGPLSIAHGRQAVIGDTISNILEFFGNDVTREYYINDTGRQIDLLVDSVSALLEPARGKEIPGDGYHGEYVRDIANKVLDNKDYQKKSKKFDLKKFILKHILNDLIKPDLKKLGIKFDSWVSQRKIIRGKKVNEVIDGLRKRGLIYEKEGALWFAAAKFDDDKDRVIKKADGELTYFASDIAYHKQKYERKYNELINLWGPDHHGYIKRVKSAISALKYSKDSLRIIIIQLVTLKTKQRMSKRAGTLILLSDLIKDIGTDTTRFYYLIRKNSSHLEFDIDLAKSASFDNPLYYIQYACARIESIFKKAKAPVLNSRFSKFLTDLEEVRLLRSLLQFSYCLEKTRYSLEPVFIIEFLKNLASSFHKFYEKRRVLVKDKNKLQARLNLLKGVKIVFECALGLLGITPARRM